MKIEIDGASEIVNAKITEDGRIYGLSRFSGKNVKVVILDD
mgnify:CR=1 FL=1